MQERELAKLFDRVSDWTYPTGTTFELTRNGKRMILSLGGWYESTYRIEQGGKVLEEGVMPNPTKFDGQVSVELEAVTRSQELLLIWRYWRIFGPYTYEPTGKAFVVKLQPEPEVIGEVDWMAM